MFETVAVSEAESEASCSFERLWSCCLRARGDAPLKKETYFFIRIWGWPSRDGCTLAIAKRPVFVGERARPERSDSSMLS